MTLRAAIVDLDGTVYRGDELVPDADQGVRALREAGLRVLFVSNNPVRSPAGFADRLRRLGVEASPDEILTSGVATTEYLVDEHPADRVFVVGESGLVSQFREAGLRVTDEPAAADVLVAAYDRSFNYDDLTDALVALRSPATAFVGTDPDRTIPSGDGGVVPGSGAIVGAIAYTTERDPDVVLGKPSQTTVDLALDRLGVPAEACLVVGDRLDTDIAMGERAGMTTALVGTGVSRDRRAADHDASPDYVLDSLATVSSVIESAGV